MENNKSKFKLFEQFKQEIVNEAVNKDNNTLTLEPKEFDNAYNGLSKFRDVLLDVLLTDNTDVQSIRPKLEEVFKLITLKWPEIKKYYELQIDYLKNKEEVETDLEDIKPEETKDDAKKEASDIADSAENVNPE